TRAGFWGHRPPPIARAKPSPGSVRVLSNPGVSYRRDRRDAAGRLAWPQGAGHFSHARPSAVTTSSRSVQPVSAILRTLAQRQLEQWYKRPAPAPHAPGVWLRFATRDSNGSRVDAAGEGGMPAAGWPGRISERNSVRMCGSSWGRGSPHVIPTLLV